LRKGIVSIRKDVTAILDKEIKEKISVLISTAYRFSDSGMDEKSFELLKKAWNLCPDPKENWNEAYNIAKYIFEYLIKIIQYNNNG
jgi:hypothetical protein